MKIWKAILIIALLGVQRISLCPELNWEKEKEYQVKQEKIDFYREILRIYNAIADVETPHIKDKYDALGKSGEYGKLQWRWSTWVFYCLKYEGKILDISIPKNQDKISIKKIDEHLNKGYNPAQIASIWNCGSPRWQGKIGTNKYGIKYNVPRYVKQFLNKYYNHGNK